MIRILLAGASGQMGLEVIKAVSDHPDFNITAGIGLSPDTVNSPDFPIHENADSVHEDYDVLIDFSHPTFLGEVVKISSRTKKPAVIATTGLAESDLAALHALSESVAILQSANLSLGIHLLAHLAQIAATTLYPQYDIEIIEAHHRRKKDAPSGTALYLAEGIRSALGDKKDDELSLVFDRSRRDTQRPDNEIGLSVVRAGTIAGEHEILFGGDDEVITLKHSAASRKIFANGALRAAEFLRDKTAGFYSMSDLF